jgi:tRNA pseudouridine55 synthase
MEIVDGVIVVDKPAGMTSHDVVNRMRRIAQTKKVGHLGTLDPMATGVLPLVIGKATRLAQFYTRNDKVYEAVIDFGLATDTYDVEGEPAGDRVVVTLDPASLERVFDRFRGAFDQVPPPFSAKKIGGKPAYQLARQQVPVELKPVPVNVERLEILECAGHCARILVHCSAGTYVRSIAHEAGHLLGCGAHLHSLRRTASGDFTIDQAHPLERLQAFAETGDLFQALIPAAELLPEIPREVVDPLTAGQIRQGRDFRVSPFQVRRDSRLVKAVTMQGELVAIGEARMPLVYHPILVF